MAQRPPRSRTAVPIASYAVVPPPAKGWNPDLPPMLMGPAYAPTLDNWIPTDAKLVMRQPFVSLHSRTNFPTLTTQSLSVAGSAFLTSGSKSLGSAAAKYLMTRRGSNSSIKNLQVDPVHAPYARIDGIFSDFTQADPMVELYWYQNVSIGAAPTTWAPGASAVAINENTYYTGIPTAAQYITNGPISATASWTVPYTYVIGVFNNALDTVNETVYTAGPRAVTCLAGHQSRLWMGGGTDLSAANYNPNQLVFSNPITPGTAIANVAASWKDPITSTFNKIILDASNEDPITALVSVGSGLLIMRRRSIYILRGSTPTSWALQLVTKEFGCVDPRSVVAQGPAAVMFMSHRGLCVSNGASVSNISGAVYHDLQAALGRWENDIQSQPGQITGARLQNELVLYSVSGNVQASGSNGASIVYWSGVYDTRTGAWHRWSSYLFDTDVNSVGNAPVARPALPAYLIQNPYYGGVISWGSHRGTYLEAGKLAKGATDYASIGAFEDMDRTTSGTCGGGANALLPIPAVWRSSYFATSGSSRFYASLLRGWVDYKQFGLNAPYTSPRQLSATWYNEKLQPYAVTGHLATQLPAAPVPPTLVATTYSERTESLPEVQHFSTDFPLVQESTHVSVILAWCANLVFATTSSTPTADGASGANEIYSTGVEFEQTRVLR